MLLPEVLYIFHESIFSLGLVPSCGKVKYSYGNR
jgi:hypothetical protein